jgi:hypothetical protein
MSSFEWPPIGALPPGEIPRHLNSQAVLLESHAEMIRGTQERNERNVVLHNLVRRAAGEMRRAAAAYPSIDVIAWCTRNLLELCLILAAVTASDQHLKSWLEQAVTDEIEVIDGFVAAAGDPSSAEVQRLRDRRSEVESFATKHKLARAKQFKMFSLADDAGLGGEYRAIYKLSSKFVHPSSWAVNLTEDQINAPDKLDILLVALQIYVGLVAGRIEGEYDHSPSPGIRA